MLTITKDNLRLLDLFSGMGGFHLGLEDAGFKFKEVYYSEVDKHAIANYKYNFPNAKYIGSVEHILNSGIERPNIITFGSPCQDFSLAGKRKGLDGDRSSLIEYALSAVSHFQPDIFIWENVKGTFSSNGGRDFIAILQAIADIGLYECEWQLVNTSWLLPQNRERIYLVGHLATSFRNWESVFPFGEDDLNTTQERRRELFSPSICSTITNKVGNRSSDTYIVNRDKARCLTGGGHSGGLHSDMDYVIQVNSATKKGFEEANKGDSINLQFPNSKTRRGRVGKGVAQTLDCNCNQGVVAGPIVKSVLTPDRAHKRQNSRRMKEDGEPSFTITSQDIHGVAEDDNIRRLTEMECERLQGFPDDWTKWGNYDGEVKQISKTQRYKMCGNAVTAKMVELIGSRIIKNYN